MSELETLDSWILHSLRETMEYGKTRNKILKSNVNSKDVVFGESIINFGDEKKGV